MESKSGRYVFEGKHADFKLTARNDDVDVALVMNKWTDSMAELVPTGRNFIGKMGYSMLKYRGLLATGKIRVKDHTIDVNGRCYFQKVRISSITPCWYWSTTQWDTGAYLQYSMFHIGIPMLRQKLSHKSNLDWGDKMISKSLSFYEPSAGREYVMKDIVLEKRYENDLPVFKINARSEEGELTAEFATYSRCCWNIRQPALGPLWLGIFYNEYPARVIDFKFKGKDGTITNKELGKSYCNCEHTWGTV
jgi:hypothetical protein